mgnify:CR=1 FL=1
MTRNADREPGERIAAERGQNSHQAEPTQIWNQPLNDRRLPDNRTMLIIT